MTLRRSIPEILEKVIEAMQDTEIPGSTDLDIDYVVERAMIAVVLEEAALLADDWGATELAADIRGLSK